MRVSTAFLPLQFTLALAASAASAQQAPLAADPAIGFRIVVPIPSVGVHLPAPNVVVIAVLPALTCPMPVATTNNSADSAMVRGGPRVSSTARMPIARSGCRNPLAPTDSSGTAFLY